MIEYKLMVIDTFDLMHKLYIHVKYIIDYGAISHKEKKRAIGIWLWSVERLHYLLTATISRRKLIKAT